MTPQQVQTAAPPIAAGLFAFALVLFLLSLRYFRKSRTDFYWRRRRSAGQRGWRIFVWSIVFTLFSGMTCVVAGVAGLVVARSTTPTAIVVSATPQATSTSTGTSTPTATMTKLPTQTASATRTPTSTATVTKTATSTASADSVTEQSPTATRTATKLTPTQTSTSTATRTATVTPTTTPSNSEVPALPATLDSSVTPSPNAKITITALDNQISATFGPVAPGNDFKAGFTNIYYFVKFSGMQSGVLWKRQLLMDGKLLEDNTSLWGLAEEGTGYFTFAQEGGFKPGYYEIRLFIGNTSKPAASVGLQVK